MIAATKTRTIRLLTEIRIDGFLTDMDLNGAASAFTDRLRGYKGYWCVAGGWAIDLFLNRQTREHEDLEIVVLRSELEDLYDHFKSFHPQKIISGESPRLIAWKGEPLGPEVIQLRTDPVDGFDFDLLLTPSESGEWSSRRDESVRFPLSKAVVVSQRGIPTLAPQIVLLFKAKYMRKKDQQDYTNIIGEIDSESKTWLVDCLQRSHPEHPWIATLSK